MFRLERFVGTTEEFAHLPATGAAARETVRLLGGHRSPASLPLFPAFNAPR